MPIHGKYATYSNHKCRCDPCRLAWNTYCRERRQLKRGPLAARRRVRTEERMATVAILREYVRPRVSITALATEAGVSRQYVSNVINGDKVPSKKLLAAAQRFGIPVERVA